MSQAAQGAQQDFWSPPARDLAEETGVRDSLPGRAEACLRCGTEFLLRSHFCHSCGVRRPEDVSASARADAAEIAGMWQRVVHRASSLVSRFSTFSLSRVELPAWLRYLHYQEIKHRLGLTTASLIAFLVGLGCVAGSLLVGLLTVKTLVEWQAVQIYRAEWLLAATASFVAGILLKKSPSGRG